MGFRFLLFFLLNFVLLFSQTDAKKIIIGSKRFTESFILGEVAKQVLEKHGFDVEHRMGIGTVGMMWEALKNGDIDIYPDYDITLKEEILGSQKNLTFQEIRKGLDEFKIDITKYLGCWSGFALIMNKDEAEKRNIHSFEDFRNNKDLLLGFTYEFINRRSGWNDLSDHYGLPKMNVKGVDHALGYVALKERKIDVKDAFYTDPGIDDKDVVIIKDNREFLKPYHATYVFKQSLPPEAVAALKTIENTLDNKQMLHMNKLAEDTGDIKWAASQYFQKELLKYSAAEKYGNMIAYITALVTKHIVLVTLSMLIAIAIGVPLGILASKPGKMSSLILFFSGMINTIPSIALLALLAPFAVFSLGMKNALFVLFIYSLLPIIRNTSTGLQQIPESIKESAQALGMSNANRLRKIYIPMATPAIMAGIKTSAVINVGNATIAALIGVGGLGEPIIVGLSLQRPELVLQGAVPALFLALTVHFAFNYIDRLIIPRGLQPGLGNKQKTATTG